MSDCSCAIVLVYLLVFLCCENMHTCKVYAYMGVRCMRTWVFAVCVHECSLYAYMGVRCMHTWVFAVCIHGCSLYAYMGVRNL